MENVRLEQMNKQDLAYKSKQNPLHQNNVSLNFEERGGNKRGRREAERKVRCVEKEMEREGGKE